MSDEEESPRSSRSARKRSSALTKLAIKKRTGLGSEDGSEFGSRGSLGGITPRSSRDRKPGRRNENHYDTDEEGDHNNVNTYSREYNSKDYGSFKDSYHSERDRRDKVNNINTFNHDKNHHDKEDSRSSNNHTLGIPFESHDVNSKYTEFSGYHGQSPKPRPRNFTSPRRINTSANNALSSDDTNSQENDDTDEELQISDETENDRARIQDQYRKVVSDSDGYERSAKDISKSDVDLRKHSRQLDDLRLKQQIGHDKRSTSLSRADVEETLSRLEEEDALTELRSLEPPQRSAHSPTPGSRSFSQSPGLGTYDRPWSARDTMGSRGYDAMSERSNASTTALFQLSTQHARDRSFLVGSGFHSGALLGAKELERYLPDRKLRVFIGTWNMAETKLPPPNVDDFVHPPNVDVVADLCVFCTQESCSNRREWEISLQESLGPQHVLYHSAGYGALYVNVFINRDLMWYCSVSEEAFISVRAMSQFKTKGGVGVCFSIFGTSLLFLNSHFTAHEGNVKVRLKDARTIVNTMNLPSRHKSSNHSYTKQPDVTSRFDNVFWCGDMNFRIDKEEERVKLKIQGLERDGNYEDLLEYDELTKVMAMEGAFDRFSEGRIKFRPSYKYKPGTNDFEDEKKRVPSYTDRVLFRCKRKGSIVCLDYGSVPEVNCSDHKPVYGVYELTLRPGRDNVSLCAGQYNKEIWKTAMTRRALRLDQMERKKTEKGSSICSIQ